MHDVLFEAHTDRICRVSGSRWVPADSYRVKLEGSGFVGHQAIFLFGLRDPLSIANVEKICGGIREEVEKHFGPSNAGKYHLLFHIYGKDAIMGSREPTPEIRSHEICVVVEAVAPDLHDAKGIVKLAKYSSFRVNYPGKVGTAGGSAMLSDEVYSSSLPRYRWIVDHLLPLDDPLEVFPMRLEEI